VDDGERTVEIKRLLKELSEATARKTALLAEAHEFAARIHEIRAAFGNPFFIDFRPDATHFATTDGLWRLMDPPGAPARVFPWAAAYVAFSVSGQRVATREGTESAIRLWDIQRGVAVRESSGAPEGYLRALDEKGQHAIIGFTSEMVWDLERDVLRASVRLEAEAAGFADGVPLLVSKSPEIGLHLMMDIHRMSIAGSATAGRRLDADRVLWMRFVDEDEVHLAVDAGKGIRFETWNWVKNTMATMLSFPLVEAAGWTVSDDERHYALVSADRIIVGEIGSRAAGVSIPQSQTPLHILLSQNGTLLATATETQVEVWKVADVERISTFTVQRPPDVVALSDDGATLAVVSHDGPETRAGPVYMLTRWSLTSESEPTVKELGRNLTPPCVSVEMIGGDGRIGLSQTDPCGNTATRQAAVELAVNALRLEHPASVQKDAMAPDNRCVATVDARGFVYVWALSPDDIVSEACSRRPRPLTAAQWEEYIGPRGPRDACGRLPE